VGRLDAGQKLSSQDVVTRCPNIPNDVERVLMYQGSNLPKENSQKYLNLRVM
jgi:hypothetical protein